MTYEFPDGLFLLRAWLKREGFDVGAFKTERQTAYLAQQLTGTRFKFPEKGQSCFQLLQKIQEAVVTGNVASEQKRSGLERITGDFPSEREQRAWGASGDSPQIRRAQTKSAHTCDRSQVSQAVPAGLVIYADGACHPNPGIGGWGFVVYCDGVEIHSDCGGDLVATNQTMELTAALMALRWFAERGIVEPVRLLSDSQYTVKGCNEWMQGWKAKGWKRGGPKAKPENAAIANLGLWQALDEALTAVPIKLEWVKGHAGIIGNERADELSEMGRETVLVPDPNMQMLAAQLSYAY